MRIGDLVRVKGKKGRPEKFVVTNTISNDMGCIEVTSMRDKRVLSVKEEDTAPYPEKKSKLSDDFPPASIRDAI